MSDGISFIQFPAPTPVNSVILSGGSILGADNTFGMSNLGNSFGTSGVVTGTGLQLVIAGGSNISLSQSINGQSATISIIGTSGGGGGGSNTFGMSNLGNTSGTTGVVSGTGLQLFFAGGNNITLSQSINGSSATLTVSAFNQTNQNNSLYALGNTTENSSTVLNASALSIAGRGGISVGYSNGSIEMSVPATSSLSATGAVSISVNASTISIGAPTQTNQDLSLFGLGNTTQNSSTVLNASVLSFGGRGNISVGYSNGTVQISGSQSNQPIGTNTIGMSNVGNTSGSSGVVTGSAVQFVLAGGNNITLSQSTNGASATVTISAPNQSAEFNTIGMGSLGNTLGMSDAAEAAQLSILFVGGNGVTLEQSVDVRSATVTWSVANQTNQTSRIYALGNTTGQSSSSTYDARTLSIEGAGAVSVGWSNSSMRISAPATSSLSATGAVSISVNANTISIGAPNQTNQNNSLYALGNTTQNSSTVLNASVLSFNGLGIVSVGYSNGSIQVSATQSNQAFTAAGGSSAFQTLAFTDTNGVSFTNTNGSVGIASVKLSMYAVSNTTQGTSGTANHTALSFGGAGAASVGVTGGSVVISVPAAGAAGINTLGMSNIGNTAGDTAIRSGSAMQIVFAGGNNITLSQSTNGSNATITVSAFNQTNQNLSLYALGNTTQNSSTVLNASALSLSAIGPGLSIGFSNGSIVFSKAPHISSYQNMTGFANSSALTFNMASVSQAAAFFLPQDGSFSFLRIPALMTTNSTTIATMASATASASGALYSTLNAVVYSVGTGANSKSLQSVAKGSGGFTFSQQISITNSTQYSISQGISMEVEGLAGRTTLSTQYSISNTNYSFTTNQIATNFSSQRFLDIPFDNSLPQGPLWLVLGASSSSASGGAAGLAALTNCNVRYSNHYGVSQSGFAFGVMGSTNMTSVGGHLGAGFFSTAGGGTTNSIPMSAISTTASNPIPWFALLRSA